MKITLLRSIKLLLLTVLIAGCVAVIKHRLDELYGEPSVVERTFVAATGAVSAIDVPEFHRDIKPVVDRRCVVCHGCYDAPCQLKMTSFESIDRGASKEKVYDGKRLLAANLTRISVDVGSIEEWRNEGFFPVLNERSQTPESNRQGSLIYRMLQLKQAHPLPPVDILPGTFDFSLNREQECAKIEEFEKIEKNKPLWGMPYGLPAITDAEQTLLERWITTGAKAKFPGIKPTLFAVEVDRWETFLNGDSLKEKLMSRYIYEHLFLANLYFSDTTQAVGEKREYFNLVRSRTPPSRAIDIIATRRPYDNPGAVVYYRLQRVKSTVLAKQHMPYRLDDARRRRWQTLFLEPEYTVSKLPGYDPASASNPFVTFLELPVRSRYEFLLDEAQFTLMGFIKGPVCRGQVALNVINDHFWILFVNPDYMDRETAEFLARQRNYLRLPAERESNELSPLTWLSYSKDERKYMRAKKQELSKRFDNGMRLGLHHLWDGDGANPNAALTIFRHFDSATVVQGLVGDTPKTAWVMGYPLLERIHYLLVAGFDVFGNVGHQLLTRLYMDFLRMEGEFNFLLFLPEQTALAELEFWYRGEEPKVEAYLADMYSRDNEITDIIFNTDNPKREFFSMVKQQFGTRVIASDVINYRPAEAVSEHYQQHLQKLADIQGKPLRHLPEQSLLRLTLNNGQKRLLSLLLNRSHSNVAQLFGEEQRVIPEEYTLTVVESVVGAYPNVFFDLRESQLPVFVENVAQLQTEKDYAQLLSKFGVRRTHPQFWDFSDDIHDYYLQHYPIEAGYLDYNRLENR